jgi:hypothetical protein
MEAETLTPEEEQQLRGEETPEKTETPAAEAAKEPEAAAETPVEKKVEKAAAKDDDEKPPKGYVKHGALHEERERRKETEKRLAELQEKWVRVDERLRSLNDKPSIPNPDEDPIGYQRYQQEQLQRNLQTTTQQLDERFKQQANEIESLRQRTYIDTQERLFSAKNPDYLSALEHFTKTRSEMLEEMGIEETERQAMLQQELGHLVNQALRANRNPAEAVYNMAKRFGYKGNGKDPAEKLDTVQKGMDTSKSLGQAGGHGAKELTAESLAEMSDEDFAKISEKDFRRIFGG